VTAKITDYNPAHFISINQGQVALYDEYKYIIHTTNLTEFDSVIDENFEAIQNELTDELYAGIIRQQTEEIVHHIKALQVTHRFARSIDFLGSALKFVAGTPDHGDFELLSTTQNFLVENNNKQKSINNEFQEKINEISNQINVMRKYFESNSVISNEKEKTIFLLLQNRNNKIIENLNTVTLSIIMAKNNIINPLLLSNLELNHVTEEKNIKITIENLLSVSKLTVAQSLNMIYYIIKIPIVKNSCNFLKLYPVIHNNTVIKLSYHEAANCRNETIPICNCNVTTTGHICQTAVDSCLFNLLNKNSADYPSQSAYHIPKIQEISEGVILLNDVPPTLVHDNGPLTVKGTVLLTFSNQIQINETTYQVIKKNIFNPEPPKLISINITEYKKELSLPLLNKLHIDNTNHIKTLNENLNQQNNFSWAIALAVVYFLFIIFAIVVLKTRPPKVQIEETIQDI